MIAPRGQLVSGGNVSGGDDVSRPRNPRSTLEATVRVRRICPPNPRRWACLVCLACALGCSSNSPGGLAPVVSETGPIPSAGASEPSPLAIGPPADDGHELTAIKPLPPSQASGLLVLPWRLVGVREHGRLLFIRYTAGGGCVAPVGVEVLENADRVLIAPRSRGYKQRRGDTACTANLRLGSGYIRLHDQLGGRRLVHAAVSPGWEDSTP